VIFHRTDLFEDPFAFSLILTLYWRFKSSSIFLERE